MRKPAFYICQNKGADQLHGYRAADQRLCFSFIDSTIPLLPKSEISSLQPSSVAVQPGLCWTWSETRKTCFLMTMLICFSLMMLMMKTAMMKVSKLFNIFTIITGCNICFVSA